MPAPLLRRPRWNVQPEVGVVHTQLVNPLGAPLNDGCTRPVNKQLQFRRRVLQQPNPLVVSEVCKVVLLAWEVAELSVVEPLTWNGANYNIANFHPGCGGSARGRASVN